ncbi:MAG: hypothetical protein NTV51_09310 [Verrucomicrobia bacterium]|nr:hypothetical protein [Verrucomicrobiota bacterium]
MLIRFIILFFIASAPCGWAASASADPVVFFKKLIIADTEAKASALPQDSGGDVAVFVQDVPVIADGGFAKAAAKFIGQRISQESLAGLEALILQYCREHDRLIVKVMAPVQDASGGVVRLAVVIGRYKDITWKGNRWFSSKMLQDKMGIKSGDEIRVSTLEEAVKWANANPFRQIKVLVNDLANIPGKADLIVGVEERIPLRLTTSYDNYGNDYVGKNHYTAALQFGNLWGRDHQGSYQFTTTDDTKLFQSHSADYRLPLPWRHYLQLSGGYLRVHPSTGVNNVITQDGKNISTSLRYVVPLRGENTGEFTAGIDFKQGNNTVAYNNVPVIANTTDTFQLAFGYSTVRRDKRGAWLFGANLNASPGNINERNTGDAFSNRKPNKPGYPLNGGKDITPTYVTGTVSVQRLLNLGGDWSLFSRATVQGATGSVPGGEQLSIGGSSTVRGFDERISSGDEGFVFSNDLQTPAIRTTLPFLKKRPPLETRFVAFYDAAQVFYKFKDANDIRHRPLASTGLGLRVALPANFVLNADYGWQRTHFVRDRQPRRRLHARRLFGGDAHARAAGHLHLLRPVSAPAADPAFPVSRLAPV